MATERRNPCGHRAVPVFATFALCDGHPTCDAKPADERCHRCASVDLYPFVSPIAPPDTTACRACGAVRWPGVVE